MFVVSVEAHFEAAHFLRSYGGAPEPLHGHSYKVVAELARAAGGLDDESLAVDFVAATRELQQIARLLDYKCINDVQPFDELSPSAENIAKWFAQQIAQAMPAAEVRGVTVWEGPFNSVRYQPEK